MADRLVVWCLASFNVAALTVAGVLSLHVLADLGDLLAGLDTATGLALSLLLWGLALWTNGRALGDVESGDEEGPGFRVLLARALAWGGATGACFLWGIVALVYLPDVSLSGAVLDAALGALGVILIASAFAALVGALIGLVVGTLDLLLLSLVPASDGDLRSG